VGQPAMYLLLDGLVVLLQPDALCQSTSTDAFVTLANLVGKL
jgi:hypothetical protein